MPKPTLVITHERSGTHLLINCINYDQKGQFYTVGYSENKKDFHLNGYKHTTYKDIMSNAYLPNSVSKSHHQAEFMEEYLCNKHKTTVSTKKFKLQCSRIRKGKKCKHLKKIKKSIRK